MKTTPSASHRRPIVRSETNPNSPAQTPALPNSGAHGSRTFRRSLVLRLALLAAAGLFTHAAFAGKPTPPPPPPPPSSGTVVLDYLYPGGSYAENFGLTVAPSGTVFASGVAEDGIDYRALVLSSSDSGSTWSLTDNLAPPGRYFWWWDIAGGIAADLAGNIYSAGLTYSNDGIQPDQWYVRRSTDGGVTWTMVDDFVPGAPANSSGDVTGIVTDAAGNVYVAGMADDVSGNQAWSIRKGVGGTSFSTVDVVPNSYVSAISAHPTAGILSVGDTRRVVTIRNKTTTSRAWLVRRSLDGGATWSTAESFQLSNGLYSAARGIGADGLGNVYVVGRGITAATGNTYVNHWLVRKSTNGGASFSTVDDFSASGSYAEALRFAATANGDLYVAGVVGGHGILRKSAGGTGAWTTVDDFPFYPHAMAADASGKLFVGGYGNGSHWIIKKY